MTNHVRIHLADDPTFPIPDGLFGQFMERASWGEPGPESALMPGTHQLQPKAIQHLRGMNLSVVRFPGGTDVDFIDWRDMIDNVPGREGKDRPITIGHRGGKITNAFGLDEFLCLREELDFTPLLVIKLKSALLRREAIEAVAYQAAALVAYCNAGVDAELREDLKPWPGIRVSNGRREPYGVPLFQIGNETWFTIGKLKRGVNGEFVGEEGAAAWYLKCLRRIIERVREVDAECQLIIDGPTDPAHAVRLAIATDPFVRANVRYLATHTYAPCTMARSIQKSINRARDEGRLPASFGDRHYWEAWSAMPGNYTENGVCDALGKRVGFISALGYEAVITEWNWNGWGERRLRPEPGIGTDLASAVGVAGFLNGMIRHADKIAFACQSMLIGSSWGITAVRVDPTGKTAPFYRPQGLATKLYANHHGTHVLPVHAEGVDQYSIDWLMPNQAIAKLDAVATVDRQHIYLHVVNRSYDKGAELIVDARSRSLSGDARIHQLRGTTKPLVNSEAERTVVKLVSEALPHTPGRQRMLRLPARTVSVVVMAHGSAGSALKTGL